jgi:nucleotide-binding universal stress UspA family protein
MEGTCKDEHVSGTIVVGVDGSDPSRGALDWALGEASLRSARLVAVHAWSFFPSVSSDPFPGGYGQVSVATEEAYEALRLAAERLLESEVSAASRAHEGVEVELQTVEGRPAVVLLEAARDAQLLVLGTRGHGGFAGLLLGSVSQQCAHHAPCPLVSVPHAEPG